MDEIQQLVATNEIRNLVAQYAQHTDDTRLEEWTALFVEDAREEHDTLCRLFRTIVGHDDAVLQIGTLLREAFETDDARHAFVDTLVRLMPERNFAAYQADLVGLDRPRGAGARNRRPRTTGCPRCG